MFCFFPLDHSLEKWKDSLETRAVLIRIIMLSWNLASPKHQRYLQKTWISVKGVSYLQLNFHAVLDEMELESDCLTSRMLFQKASRYICQFCTKVCRSSRLQGSSTTCNSKLKFPKRKDLFIKIVRKN